MASERRRAVRISGYRIVESRGKRRKIDGPHGLLNVGQDIERFITPTPAELKLVPSVHLGEVDIEIVDPAEVHVQVRAGIVIHAEARVDGAGEAKSMEGIGEPELAGNVFHDDGRNLSVVPLHAEYCFAK
jgi:hypothetical protein